MSSHDGFFCSICLCWYAEAIASAGDLCGDLSHQQSEPCPGILARCDPDDEQYRQAFARAIALDAPTAQRLHDRSDARTDGNGD